MNLAHKLQALLLAAATAFALNAHAAEPEPDPVKVAQWNFNAGTTKHNFSQNGAGITFLGVTNTLVSQNPGGQDGKSSDTASGQALNTQGYSASAANMTAGVEFAIDTTGYQNLTFSFDQRNSGTGSGYTALLYTVDGDNWLFGTQFRSTTTAFTNGRSFSFAGLAGVDNNEFFAIRLVSMFAPGTNAYVGTTGNFASTGTVRYDMVTLMGSEIIAAPVPEASTTAMMLAGLLAVGVVARRRRQG